MSTLPRPPQFGGYGSLRRWVASIRCTLPVSHPKVSNPGSGPAATRGGPGIAFNPRSIFTVDDATQLVDFAKSKGIGWLSMWSSTRDKQCAAGAVNHADATCSSILQQPLAFTKAFAAYK